MRTSGRRRISAVPEFWSRSSGARTSGRGRGRAVRKGFVLRAVVRAWRALGGQIRVMSERKLGFRVELVRGLGHAPEMPMR